MDWNHEIAAFKRQKPAVLSPVPSLIDHTLLKAEATTTDIDRLCNEAKTWGFKTVCVNGKHVKQAAAHGVAIACVVGFPLGASLAKAYETQRAVDDGATEIDMVIDIGALKEKDYDAVYADIMAVKAICAHVKVIFETALLSNDEIIAASTITATAGAMLKTSTGFNGSGATPEIVALMAQFGDVKASGGIRTLQHFEAMLAAGAHRVGCSSSVAIMHELQARKTMDDTARVL